MNPFQNPSLTGKPKQAVERTDLTGILMAGGKSSRMGQEKGLVEFRGRKFIQYGIDLLASYTGKVIISSSNPEYLSYGLEMVPDEIAGQGPAAGLASALKKTSTRWNLVIACDLPFLQPELIDELLSQSGTCQAVIPVHQGVMEPLAGLYDKSLGIICGEAVSSGNLALHKILKSCEVHYIDTEHLLEKYPNMFTNFNSLEEMDLFDGK